MKSRIGAITSLIVVLTAAACGGEDGDSQGSGTAGGEALADVTLLLDFFVDGLHAPVFVAQEKGYFEDNGVSVTIQPGQGSANSVQLVDAGQADFGLADAGTVSQAIASGADVTAVGVLLKQTPSVTLASTESGIEQPQDLAGASIGDAQQASTAVLLPAFLEANGLSADDVTFVGMSFETRVPSLQGGQVDAIGGYAQEFVTLEDVVAIPWYEHGIDSYGTVIIANNDYLAENADTAGGVLAAIQAGLDDTLADPAEAAQLTAADDRGDESYFVAELEALAPFFTDEQGAGLSMDEARWQATQDLMMTYGEQASEVSMDELFTNDYLD